MNRTARFGFVAVWLVVALAALVLHVFWKVNADFLGVVETRTHKMGAREAGRVRQVAVALGDAVAANQLLAVMDTSDLDTERQWVVAELKGLEASLDADRIRYSLEYERMRMQGDASQAGLVERRAAAQAKKAELAAVNAEIARLSAAERSGLGRSRDLNDLQIRRDALAQFVREVASTRADPASRARTAAPRGASDADSVVLSMLGDRFQHVSELKLRLQSLDERIERRRILSPCAGHVVVVNAMPGDDVEGFAPILTVEEPVAAFIDVYIPETSDYTPRAGQRVRVYPHRSGAADAHGTVVFIDPGYSAIPQRLAFRNMVYWARKFRVRLDDGHSLMPGEAAKVEMTDETFDFAAAAAAERPVAQPAAPRVASPTATPVTLGPSEIHVPDSLRARSRFEPSGIVWLADIDRFLIASDDTSRDRPEHAPWLFLMDRQGTVEPEPIVLAGAEALNDLEAIAQDPDGMLYLVSSQSPSRKGNRPASRRQIYQVRRDGRDFRVVGQVDLVDVLTRSMDASQRKDLGLEEGADPDSPPFEIEAAAWYRGALLLGLKSPRPRDGALLWRLDTPNRLFQDHVLRPGQLSLAARVDLRTSDGRPAAFSDLAVDAGGTLFALSTVPDPSAAGQEGGLHRLVSPKPGILQSTLLRSYPGLKPEGLGVLPDGRFTLVFDGDDTPPFLFLSTEMNGR